MRTRTSALRAAAGCLAMGVMAMLPAHAQERPAHPFADSRPIANRYIVIFRDNVRNHGAEAARIANAGGGQLHHTYNNVFKGFSATLPAQALNGLRNNPNIESIEQDQTVSLTVDQLQATWGLDRIDQESRPLDTIYRYNATGAGVFAYIIDTGIRSDHVEFTGRFMAGVTTINDGRGTQDCNGHGTHVAGTVGGTTWGVAKQVTLVPVRVLDCRGSGSWSGVVAGIDWVANNAMRPAVANLSLGGGYSAAVNTAVANAAARGITMVVAAGNSNANACNYSPASTPAAITVGATTSSDARASYSNYGTCVDLFAPGSSITSAWYTSGVATSTISGTSMASPHVAGVAGLALQANPDASAAAIASLIVANAEPGRLSSLGSGSPNLLLQSQLSGVASEPVLVPVATNTLTGTTAKSGSRSWRATVTIGARNVTTGAAASGVTVSGTFTNGGSVSCVTGSAGSCSASHTFSNSVTGTQFTVTGLSGPGMVYDANANRGVTIPLAKP